LYLLTKDNTKTTTIVKKGDADMKVKIFSGEHTNVEKEINKWLQGRNLEIVNLTQSSRGGNLITITIIYN
jgi:hypothetical protein